MENIFAKLVELQQSGRKCALCILTTTSGSVPRKAGAKMIVTSEKEIFGTIGGGKVEQQTIEKALSLIGSRNPEKIVFNLEDDLEMHCGGSVEVYLEPIISQYELVIFGAGHVGLALARMAKNFGFQITLVDTRSELMAGLENDGFVIVNEDYVAAAEKLETHENSFLVVTTPRHQSDETVTGILGKKPYKYLGMIGSRKKVATAKEKFKRENLLSDDQVQKIDMPIGIPFNAETPQEIAVSILAKIIDVKNT